MGYYTRYTSSVSGPDELMEQFVEHAENGGKVHECLTYSDLLDGMSDLDSMKWYHYNEDMTELSRRYPHLLFALEGEGEEPGDLWKGWFRNGKSHIVQARIVFDEPDLEVVLPNPDAAAAIAARKEAKRKQVQAKIDELKSELESI